MSEFADLIVINKKDLVPVSASEMQNKYFQESVKSTLGEPLFKKASFYESDIVAKVDPRTYKSTQSIIKKNIHKNPYNENIHPNHLKRIRMEF